MTGNHHRMSTSARHQASPTSPADRMSLSLILNDTSEDSRATSSAASRSSSISYNTSPTAVKRPRQPRAKYSDEEGYFIWYHRTDLGLPWEQVEEKFFRWWGQARPMGGLQCKFYRLLDYWGVEKVREQTKFNHGTIERVGKFGLVQRTNLRFEWMLPQHKTQKPLNQFCGSGSGPNGVQSSSCGGCSNCRT